ncbi:MAG: SRPBCC family protein [Verrucomicrobiales bacterium]
MPLIRLQTQIEAPIERVFDLARSIDAHQASTRGSGERAVAGRSSGLIGAGERVTWEARHFGIKQRLAVRVTLCERPHHFADEMISGAFSSMQHSHRFEEAGIGTLMTDEFRYSAPLGILGRIAEGLFLTSYLKNFLTKRAMALKEMAETDEWQRYLPDNSPGCL